MTNPIKQLDLAAIEQSQVVRIAGANLTIGGLTSAGVILLVAFAAHWLVTRSLRRLRERADRSRQAVYLLERLAGYAIIVIAIILFLFFSIFRVVRVIYIIISQIKKNIIKSFK